MALASLGLGIRTDRRESQTRLRIELFLGADGILLHVTNMAQRRVTAQRTGFAATKRDDRALSFIGWDERNAGASAGRMHTEPAFPKTLEPGAPTYVARAGVHLVRTAVGRDMPAWVWCEDERGKAYWARVPAIVRVAVRATKRRVPGPDDDYGHPTYVEVNDD